MCRISWILHLRPVPLKRERWRLLSISSVLGLLLWGLCAQNCLGQEEPSFNTVRVDGRTYVNLSDFARVYDFVQSTPRTETQIRLKNKYRSFEFKVGNRECFVNGVRM